MVDMIRLIFCSVLGMFTYLKFSNSDLWARNLFKLEFLEVLFFILFSQIPLYVLIQTEKGI